MWEKDTTTTLIYNTMKQEEVKQIELQVKSMLDKLQNEKAPVPTTPRA